MRNLITALIIALPAPAFANFSDTDLQLSSARILKDLHAATQQSSKQKQAEAMCRLADDVLQIVEPGKDGLGTGIAATLLGTFGKGRYWKTDRDGILAFADLTSSVVVSKFYDLLAEAGDWDYTVGSAKSAGSDKVVVPGTAGKLDLELFFYRSTGKIFDVKANGLSLVGQYRGIFQRDLQDMKDDTKAVSRLVESLTSSSRRLPINCN